MRRWSALPGAIGLMAALCATACAAVGDRERRAAPAAPSTATEAPFAPRSPQYEAALRAYDEQRRLTVFDWAALEARFRAAVEEDGQNAEAWLNLGVALERQGKLAEADVAWSRALALDPGLQVAAENRAALLSSVGRADEAIELYEALVARAGEEGAARANLAVALAREGELERAKALAREALMYEPASVQALNAMIRAHLAAGEVGLARLLLARALKLAENDPSLHTLYGTLLEREGNDSAAAAELRKAISLRAELLEPRVLLARIALRRRDWPTVAEQLERVLQRDPTAWFALLDRALALEQLGKASEARSALEQALALAPKAPLVHLSLGVHLHLFAGELERAREHYRAFLSLQGGSLADEHPIFELLERCETALREKSVQE